MLRHSASIRANAYSAYITKIIHAHEKKNVKESNKMILKNWKLGMNAYDQYIGIIVCTKQSEFAQHVIFVY